MTNSALQFLVDGVAGAAISPLDRGFAYGEGVFRTFLVRQGVPVHWQAQYQKLVHDCLRLQMVCPSAELLLQEIACLCANEAKSKVAIKIIITRGVGGRGYAHALASTPTRVVIQSDFPIYLPSYFTQGVCVRVCQTRLGHQPLLAGVKHLNRLENVLARAEWQDGTTFEGLLLDVAGNVIEGTMSNVWVRQGDKLVTPELGSCGVAGCVRELLLNLPASALKACGVRKVCAEPLDLPTLLGADEVLLSNSLFGVLQVTTLLQAKEAKPWAEQSLAQKLRKALQYDEEN